MALNVLLIYLNVIEYILEYGGFRMGLKKWFTSEEDDVFKTSNNGDEYLHYLVYTKRFLHRFFVNLHLKHK